MECIYALLDSAEIVLKLHFPSNEKKMPPFFNTFKNSHLNCNFPANHAGTAHCGFNLYFLITEAERFLHPFICHSLNIFHGLSGITSLVEAGEIKMYIYVHPFPFQTVV